MFRCTNATASLLLLTPVSALIAAAWVQVLQQMGSDDKMFNVNRLGGTIADHVPAVLQLLGQVISLDMLVMQAVHEQSLAELKG